MLNYNKLAVDWEVMQKYSPASRHRRRLILGILSGFVFKSVLDVGCGRGFLLREIGRRFTGVGLHGSEVSEMAVAHNRDDFPDIEFYRLDLISEALPNSFDLVICSEVLEHLDDFRRALGNLAKMSQRYILITTPSCPLFPSDEKMGHFRHFHGSELTEAMRSNGFVVKYIVKWGFPFFNFYKHLINGVGAQKIDNAFNTTAEYGMGRKLLCQILYYLFFLNLRSHADGYQLLLLGERIVDEVVLNPQPVTLR